MIARTRNVSFFAFLRRLDRRLLLRAPMLWRTRGFHLLTLLILAIVATVPFIQTSIKDLSEVYGIAGDTVLRWKLQLYVAMAVLGLWPLSIIRKPVGELPPRRHVVTVVVVTIGSYLFLITPSLLAYPQIQAIKSVGPSDQVLKTDFIFLSEYRGSSCDAGKLEQLRDVLARYQRDPGRDGDFRCDGDRTWRVDLGAWNARQTIEMITDARNFGPNYTERNQFYGIWIDHFWWFVIALGIGILTVILSYPAYVWRRILLRQ